MDMQEDNKQDVENDEHADPDCHIEPHRRRITPRPGVSCAALSAIGRAEVATSGQAVLDLRRDEWTRAER